MIHIAFVVPTKDRPEDLARLLESLAVQSRKPDQLIVVDGSDPPVKRVCDAEPRLQVDYARVFPPSLAGQRNAGMQRLRAEITHAGYLDDDVVLEADAIEKMVEFWEGAPADLGGAGFNIVNNPAPGAMWIKRLFLIDHPRRGRLLASGFPSSFAVPASDVEADWLNGGATVWRRAVIDEFPYDEWFVGTGFMEDVDYSFTVRSKYRLAVASGARLAHYSRPVRTDRQYLLGKWQIVNRFYVVRKHLHRGLNRFAAWWASLGVFLLNGSAAISRLDVAYLHRARGNAAGMFAEILGRNERIGGHLK